MRLFPALLLLLASALARADDTVYFVLDASSSMNDPGQDGRPKLDSAKETILKEVPALRKEGVTRMGLAVFGRRAGDCHDIEAMVHPSAGGAEAILQAVPRISAHGKTPLAAALRLAKAELQQMGGGQPRGQLFVLTDGIETCEGDPVAAAKSLNERFPYLELNLIGIGVKEAEARALARVARAADGKFEVVNSREELEKAVKNGAHQSESFLAPKIEVEYAGWCGYSNECLQKPPSPAPSQAPPPVASPPPPSPQPAPPAREPEKKPSGLPLL